MVGTFNSTVALLLLALLRTTGNLTDGVSVDAEAAKEKVGIKRELAPTSAKNLGKRPIDFS